MWRPDELGVEVFANGSTGKDYKYSHDFAHSFIAQEFLPKEISGQSFFEPGNNPREAAMRLFLKTRWKDKYGY